jgi:Family of unknown function (DUF6491)
MKGDAKMKTIALAAVAMLAVSLVPAQAKSPTNSGDASIPFVNHGGIRDWQAPNDHTLYVQGGGGKWYRADLLGTCQDLQFATRIGFDGGATDTFDRFSKIIVRGQRCQVSSLTKIEGAPPTKAKHHKSK